MTMPHASSASLIPDHDDSVEENDKDFAKLKGEEEDNTPVVSMSQDSVEENDKDFAKLKDSDLEEEDDDVPKRPYTEEEARQAFNLWRKMFLVKEYADQSEYEKRFKFFKASLYRKVSPIWEMTALNKMSLADRSPREILADGHYCSITIKEIHEWYEEDYRYKQEFF